MFVIFALLLVPLTMGVGVAVDLGRLYLVRHQAQAAVDDAALAGVRAAQLTTSEKVPAASEAAKTLFGSRVIPHAISATLSDIPSSNGSQTEFTWTAEVWVQTPFIATAAIIDKKGAETSAPRPCAESGWFCRKVVVTSSAIVSSEGQKSGTSIETTLILDLTASMCSGNAQPCLSSGKLDALKASAKDLIDILVFTDATSTYSKLALVPYSQAVNVGTYASQIRGSISSGTCNKPGCNKYRFVNAEGQSATHVVSSCVTERTGNESYTDAAPAIASFGRNYPGPTNGCIGSYIVPLSNNKDALKAQIDQLQASGSSAGHIGVAWGWYLLSPNFNYLWPSSAAGAYADTRPAANNAAPKLKKIAILMTDGECNSAYCNGIIAKDSTTGGGSLAEMINCNATNGSSYEQAKAQCRAMKAANIEIYTVGFEVVDDQRARDLLANCATDSSHNYLASDGDALRQTFRDIALKISSMRLTH